jgi:hypothetical protein
MSRVAEKLPAIWASVGNAGAGACALPDAAVFVGEEEEQFVALDGAAEGAAEVVVAVFAAGGEEVAGVEFIVAEEFEEGAVKVVGAGFGDDVDLGAAVAAVVGGVGVAFDADFGDGVEVDHGEVVAVEGVDVAAAVEGPIVGAGLTAAEGEGDAGVGAEAGLLGLHGADTGLEGHQLGEAAGIEGEFLDLGAIDGGADVGRGGVDLGGAGFNADGVGDRADGELGVDADGLRGADSDVVGFGFLEAGFFEGEGVGAGGDLGRR